MNTQGKKPSRKSGYLMLRRIGESLKTEQDPGARNPAPDQSPSTIPVAQPGPVGLPLVVLKTLLLQLSYSKLLSSLGSQIPNPKGRRPDSLYQPLSDRDPCAGTFLAPNMYASFQPAC